MTILILLGCRSNENNDANSNNSPYGKWEVCDYKDDFGKPTGKKFVRQIVSGTFSNSATISSPLMAYVFLYQYDYNGDYSIDGEIYFDEYDNLVKDWKIFQDASPSEYCKIVDNTNKRVFEKANRYIYFAENGVKDKSYRWIDIFVRYPSKYSVTIKGEHNTMYYFDIDTEKLPEALTAANIKSENPNDR
ncbi:MAG: hypothetical protein J6X91_02055 [Bacteroidales bacterium]|nr:hypothetical protein [Bacteroidales bacterium]